ncbi:MAG: Ig-like domain repeat protein [Treponema sp.]|jgi:hypothetical protein|nr:Ig-like domain repeat protein [Treponema sp.]
MRGFLRTGTHFFPWRGFFLLPLGLVLLISSAVWAGGRNDKIDTQTAEGREIWQKEFDLTEVKRGKYNVLIRARDAAGNTAESGPFNITVDPRAGLPVARVVYPEPNQILRQDIKVIGVASGRFGVKQVMVRLDDREYSPAEGSDYWTRLIETGALNEGRHVLYAQAIDSKDTPGPEYSVAFVIDKSPPSVELVGRKTGDIISGNLTITGRADDPNSISAVSWSVDGETFTPLSFKTRRGETAVEFSFPVRTRTLEDGPVVYYLRASDITGAEITRPYLFFVDNNGPELEILSPGADEDVYGKVHISGRIYDRVGLDRFYYEWAGEEVDIPRRPGDPFWTVGLEISAAQNRNTPLRVVAVDKSGNTTVVTRRLQDNRRVKTPAIVIDYPDAAGLNALPPNGAIYGHIAPGFFPASIIMEGVVEYIDARSAFRITPDMIASGRSSLKLWAMAEDETLGAPVTIRVNKPADPPPPPDGAAAQYDLTPSAVSVTSPEPYTYVPNTFVLQGTLGAPGARLEYRLAPTDTWKPLAVSADSSFTANIGLSDLEPGPVHLELRTVRGGVENFPYYHPVNKYTGGPEIGFLFPTPDLGAIHGTVTVSGAVNYSVPLREIAYSLDGAEYTPLDYIAKYDKATFTFPCDFTALDKAGGRLILRVADVSGVVTERTHFVSFNAATDMPTLILNSPADEEVITRDFEISGIAFDDDGVSAIYWRILKPRIEVSPEGETGEGAGEGTGGEEEPEFNKISTAQSFAAPIPFADVVDGENTVQVYVEDIYGTVGPVLSRIIKVSTEPPVTVVEFPQFDKYNRRAITVTGTAADANGIKEILISMDNGNTYQRAEGAEEWYLNLNTSSYLDGVYSVLLRTTDNYGIEAFSNALINIDNTPPEISLGTPMDGDMAATSLNVAGLAVSGIDVTGQAHDDVGLQSMTVQMISADDTSQQAVYDVTPNFVIQESLDVSNLPAGAYILKMTGVDLAGNETTVARNVVIAVNQTASEIALVNPMPGEDHAGPLVISGHISGAVIPNQIALLLNGQRFAFADVDRYGVFRYPYPNERLTPGQTMVISASFISPSGQEISSPEHEIRVSPWGPTLEVESHKDGDVITQRPWISGRAWTAISEEDAAALTKKELRDLAVENVFISLDNGRSFEKTSGKEQWKFRLETGDLAAGPLPVLIKAEFPGGKTAVRRIILTVDTSPPQITTVGPVENSTHRDVLSVYGGANDDHEIDSVEISLRPGDKAGYSVPQFIQGLYFDFHVLGATPFEYGLGLSFFEDNVKIQFQAGQAEPGTRYSGWVFGAKLLANVFYLPFDYFLGPDWTFFSMTFAFGANFSYFTMEEEESPVFMGAVLGQWEFARVDFSKIFPKWQYLKSVGLYVEPDLWFASSDVSAGVIFRLTFGTRIIIF